MYDTRMNEHTKGKLLYFYTEILYHLEDFFGAIESFFNKQRKNIDDKHWDIICKHNGINDEEKT